METKKNRCVVIGSDALLIECGEQLLERAWSIARVYTNDDGVKTWALSNGLRVENIDRLGVEDRELGSYEFVFNIGYIDPIPPWLWQGAKTAAFKFHNGLLPQYAGHSAPAFAIMEGQSEFGVCWHHLTEGDGLGAVLVESRYAVDPDDSSLTLKMKSFEAALSSFSQLLDLAAAGSLDGEAQDLTTRRYIARDARPRLAGTIDWLRPATESEAMVRALDFGTYANELALAKLWHADQLYVVADAVADDHDAGRPPGTVLELSTSALRVATARGTLTITALRSLDGAPVSIDRAAADMRLRTGDQLESVPTERATLIDRAAGLAAVSEPLWANKTLIPSTWSLPNAAEQVPSGRFGRRRIAISDAFRQCFAADGDWAIAATWLATLQRLTGAETLALGYTDDVTTNGGGKLAPWFVPMRPIAITSRLDTDLHGNVERLRASIDDASKAGIVPRDFVTRMPGTAWPRLQLIWGGAAESTDLVIGATMGLHIDDATHRATLVFDDGAWSAAAIDKLVEHIEVFAASCAAAPALALARQDLLGEADKHRVLDTFNPTETELDAEATIDRAFFACAAKRPDAIALKAGGESLTYRAAAERVTSLAARLRSEGVDRGQLVGVCLRRTIDLPITLLAVLAAGATYLPLDPKLPAERMAFVIDDAKIAMVLCERSTRESVAQHARTLLVDGETKVSRSAIAPATKPDDLAYVIYTSGSTGQPKGVLVEHRQVINFFAGMDQRIGGDEPGVWLAVTSASFDISVLELLWTLTRGYCVVVHSGVARSEEDIRVPHETGSIDFGLMMWANEDGEPKANVYDVMLESAKFGDTHGFSSISLPERHFHAFGGVYPNPAVTAAAVAAVTNNIEIRTGSVVIGLHHPLRLAEDWAVVDNLSNGRVGLSIAAGWHPNDFVIAPENYDKRREDMPEQIDLLRRLWRGEKISYKNPLGEEVPTQTWPRPRRKELPIWITAAGNPETFREAGQLGYHLLTHLLGQTTNELGRKLDIYRQAWRDAGHPGSGHVTVMLHTFIGVDREQVREAVKGPFQRYLTTAADLLRYHFGAWTSVRTPLTEGPTVELTLDDMELADVQSLLDFAFDRYFETSALFGTPESCLPMVERMKALGVDEISCLVDFGVDSQTIIDHLPFLDQLRRAAQKGAEASVDREPIGQAIRRHAVTHLQCTPSMATMLLADPQAKAALGELRTMMVGGEALTPELASRLRPCVGGQLLNMYGPTETTIWSATSRVDDPEHIDVGTPIANTRLYVLDKHQQLASPGQPGELYIGGAGVARGYLRRPTLSAERFLSDPFSTRPRARMYRTGDRVRWNDAGHIEFLGRVDHQIKLRGHRIELGEIEAVLRTHDGVDDVAVIAVGSGEETRLVAHVVANPTRPPDANALRRHVVCRLPEAMVPASFLLREFLPLSSSGKVDRPALAALSIAKPKLRKSVTRRHVAATQDDPVPDAATDVPTVVEGVWKQALGLESIDKDGNFFDLGGHSLLAIKVQAMLRDRLARDIPLLDLFRYTTVRTLSEHLGDGQAAAASDEAAEIRNRAQRRVAMRKRALRSRAR